MGKGNGPEKGRNRELFRANYDDIFRKKADEDDNLKELTALSDEIGLKRVKDDEDK